MTNRLTDAEPPTPSAPARLDEETLAALDKVERAARDSDSYMVPIGGGNPYYHCRYCGVTNVELTSRPHNLGCPANGISVEVPAKKLRQLIDEVRALRAALAKASSANAELEARFREQLALRQAACNHSWQPVSRNYDECTVCGDRR